MASIRDSLKQQEMEAEMSRFEAEILSPSYAPVISANTYSQVQQQLQTHAQFVLSSFFLPPQIQRSSGLLQAATANTGYPYLTNGSLYTDTYEPEKVIKKEEPVSSIPTPAVISAAPKVYSGRHQIVPAQPYAIYQPEPDSKLTEIAKKEELLSKAREMAERVRASTIITTSRDEAAVMRRRRIDTKPRKYIRVAGGQVWEDNSLSDWDPDDFRIFCGDLGNDVTDDVLTRAFSRYPSFLRAKVIRDKRTNKTKGFGFISFKDPQDFTKAMKEMNGKYVGSRPIKLRKSSWRERNVEIVHKKALEKTALGLLT